MATERIWRFVVLSGWGLVALAGCGRSERIASYTVNKPLPMRPAANPDQPNPHAMGPEGGSPQTAPRTQPAGEPTERMLGAIVPLKGQGWFFKLTGPKDAVAAKTDEFVEFLKSVHFSVEGKPAWTLPAGWQEQPGSQLRYATLVIAGEGKPLEVSVTALSNSLSNDEEYALVNINRWRGQLSLPPISAAQLVDETTTIPLSGATATMINIVGTSSGDGMRRGPFMSGARDGN